MIQINKNIIKNMNPCKSRFDENYLIYYSDFNGTLDEFLDLDKITYDDKIWVARRLLNKNQSVHFAILCAESVLNIYEAKYPTDKRISDCLSFMKTIVDFSDLSNGQRAKLIELREDTYQARRNAYAAYADAAADAADAAYAAYAAADADAYAYADAAAAADAAAYAAYAAYADADAADAADARKNQQDLNLQFLKLAASL